MPGECMKPVKNTIDQLVNKIYYVTSGTYGMTAEHTVQILSIGNDLITYKYLSIELSEEHNRFIRIPEEFFASVEEEKQWGTCT